ncbi:MAG TPA: T9SS type A sorting domain-containing protein [bacterium]|nr:T9SS type A sorting domain-containing protein [bacterium]
MFATVLSIVLVAFSPAGTAPTHALAPVGFFPRAPLGGGGPDTYGYRYLDSDTNCPGAPTYSWKSIKGVGTKVTGLLDDNVEGPFSIGFNFPYYWYRVNSVIVGSNGYISFGDATIDRYPFKGIPNTAKPNNLVAPLLSDLDCTDTVSTNGSVWYWTNHSDSFIVEYDSIKFWSTGGNNTFQIILTKADSSIKCQYQQQSGTPYGGWADTTIQVGIENFTGAIGLNYLHGTTPVANAIHDSLAVRFFPPESTTLHIHDVGVRNAMNDRSGGMFTVNGRPLSFWAVVENYGNQAEAGYQTYFKVTRQSGGAALFSDSIWASPSNPGIAESLLLGNAWRPSTNGTYIIKIFTKLTGDMAPSNDTATIELHVVTMPALLTYDNGTAGNMWYFFYAHNGWANRFVPPVYPCTVQSARVYLAERAAAANTFVGIFADNGPGGIPGDTLYDSLVSVSTQQWYTVTPSHSVVINSGAFYVGAVSTVDSEPTFGTDSVPPLSYQKWECLSGTWAPDPDQNLRDVMMNATISGPVGIFETTDPAPMKVPARIDVSPNPFGGMTSIRLLNPTGREKAFEIYDATGSIVRTLAINRGRAMLDGKRLADGIYFARIAGTEAPVAKVIVTH